MPKGPGTILRETLRLFGITDNGCGCTELANEMDSVGPVVVQEKFEEYVQKMKESIKRWRRNTGLPIPPPPEITVRKLLQFALSKSLEIDQNQAL